MADTANNNKPFKQFSRIGNASFELATWPNGGRNTVAIKVASKLRNFTPTSENPEPSPDYVQFHDFGQFEIYPSDVPNILDLCVHLRPDMILAAQYNARRVA